VPADSADGSSAQGAAGLAPAGAAAAQVPDRYLQALVRYLLLAESGCEAAAENAAWMLLHAQGASGPRAVGLAAHLLYRCAGFRHTVACHSSIRPCVLAACTYWSLHLSTEAAFVLQVLCA
jgi:hypothetical protein